LNPELSTRGLFGLELPWPYDDGAYTGRTVFRFFLFFFFGIGLGWSYGIDDVHVLLNTLCSV
jgi:hypothetical protein